MPFIVYYFKLKLKAKVTVPLNLTKIEKTKAIAKLLKRARTQI